MPENYTDRPTYADVAAMTEKFRVDAAERRFTARPFVAETLQQSNLAAMPGYGFMTIPFQASAGDRPVQNFGQTWEPITVWSEYPIPNLPDDFAFDPATGSIINRNVPKTVAVTFVIRCDTKKNDFFEVAPMRPDGVVDIDIAGDKGEGANNPIVLQLARIMLSLEVDEPLQIGGRDTTAGGVDVTFWNGRFQVEYQPSVGGVETARELRRLGL